MKKLLVVGYGIALILASAGHVSAFYHPTAGKWLSRDPIGEWGGLSLYGFVGNSPLIKNDQLGLATRFEPAIPHVSNDRHNNYLIFHVSCPKGFKVSHVRADYNDADMYSDMFDWWWQNSSNRPQSEKADKNKWKEWYAKLTGSALSSTGGWTSGVGSFGGIQDPGRPNCDGRPVEVHAYMRTRLVAPAGEFALWRAFWGTPDPNSMIGIYQEQTQIHYTCDDCCGRGNKSN